MRKAGAGSFTTALRLHVMDRMEKARQREARLWTDTFLALVSDQNLRTTVIAGRPDLGHPDWQHCVPGRAMTDSGSDGCRRVAGLPSGKPIPASRTQALNNTKKTTEELFMPEPIPRIRNSSIQRRPPPRTAVASQHVNDSWHCAKCGSRHSVADAGGWLRLRARKAEGDAEGAGVDLRLAH